MHRLLLWSILLAPLAQSAVAQVTGPHEPQRLQAEQLTSPQRSISPSSAFEAPDFGKPDAYQRPSTERHALGNAPNGDSPDGASAARYLASAEANTEQARQSNLQVTEQNANAPKPLSEVQKQSPGANAPLAVNGPLPIAHRNSNEHAAAVNKDADRSAPGKAAAGVDSLFTVIGSLSIVLGLFLVTMWCIRRSMPKAARTLPREVVEVLGRAPLAGKQQMHLIRFGRKLVLAAVSPAGVDSISEITDPAEVDRLAGYCEEARPASATTSFRGILDRLEDDHGRSPDESRRPNRGLASLAGLQAPRGEDAYA